MIVIRSLVKRQPSQELIDLLNEHALNQTPWVDRSERLKTKLKSELFPTSYYKCSFCEGTLYLTSFAQIEHYVHKTLHPELTYEWDNLLPICQICNNKKRSTCPLVIPLLNPYIYQIEENLIASILKIVPKPGIEQNEYVKIDNTLSKYAINRSQLQDERANILKELLKTRDEISIRVSEIKNEENEENNIFEITALINGLTILSHRSKKYSFIIFDMLRSDPLLQEAKTLISK